MHNEQIGEVKTNDTDSVFAALRQWDTLYRLTEAETYIDKSKHKYINKNDRQKQLHTQMVSTAVEKHKSQIFPTAKMSPEGLKAQYTMQID